MWQGWWRPSKPRDGRCCIRPPVSARLNCWRRKRSGRRQAFRQRRSIIPAARRRCWRSLVANSPSPSRTWCWWRRTCRAVRCVRWASRASLGHPCCPMCRPWRSKASRVLGRRLVRAALAGRYPGGSGPELARGRGRGSGGTRCGSAYRRHGWSAYRQQPGRVPHPYRGRDCALARGHGDSDTGTVGRVSEGAASR